MVELGRRKPFDNSTLKPSCARCELMVDSEDHFADRTLFVTAIMSSLIKHPLAQFGVLSRHRSQRLFASARSQLLSTLAILEQREGQLIESSLNTFTAAGKLGGTIHGFLAGANVTAAAERAAKVQGIDQIIKVENPTYEKVSSSNYPFSCRSD